MKKIFHPSLPVRKKKIKIALFIRIACVLVLPLVYCISSLYDGDAAILRHHQHEGNFGEHLLWNSKSTQHSMQQAASIVDHCSVYRSTKLLTTQRRSYSSLIMTRMQQVRFEIVHNHQSLSFRRTVSRDRNVVTVGWHCTS